MATTKAPAKLAKPAVKTIKPTITAVHQQDMDNLSKIMFEAAEKHGLCDVFYQTVEKANKTLTVPVAAPTKVPKVAVALDILMPNLPVKFANGDNEGRLTVTQIADLEKKLTELLGAAFKAEGWKVTPADVSVDCYVYGEYAS